MMSISTTFTAAVLLVLFNFQLLCEALKQAYLLFEFNESIFSKVNQSGLRNFSGCANCRTFGTEHTIFEYLVIIRKVPV